jgi:hypothetical protein
VPPSPGNGTSAPCAIPAAAIIPATINQRAITKFLSFSDLTMTVSHIRYTLTNDMRKIQLQGG